MSVQNHIIDLLNSYETLILSETYEAVEAETKKIKDKIEAANLPQDEKEAHLKFLDSQSHCAENLVTHLHNEGEGPDWE